MISTRRLAGVDRADARASSVAREPPRGFFGETAALRVAGFLAAGFLLVTTTSGAASRKKYAATPAPIAVARRMVSRLTLEALAVCARVRRVAGIVFFD